MATATLGHIRIHYEEAGSGNPVMLLTGLGGVGRAWGDLVPQFAAEFHTIVPDHRGTGQSSRPRPDDEPYTIAALAADMAGTLRQIGCGPAHIVGSSTGGALAQVMALDHPEVVRSITLASSWARADNHFRHQFAARKRILLEAGLAAYTEASALLLYSPQFVRDRYDVVRAWCDRAAGNTDLEIMAARIDMIVAHDTMDRLGDISVPTLVIVGDIDACTPPVLSKELAAGISGAEYAELPGGHLIYKEQPDQFWSSVATFLRSV